MASSASATPSLTPSRSPTPEPPIQPDHFYGNDIQLPPSPSSDGRTWLDPNDDLFAQRGIPVFKPTMDEFQDFEGYMNKIECWGNKSGIVKVIPPKEWTDSLPPVNPQLANVKLKNPIEQQMMGHAGLFRQQNIEKRKIMSVREWAELCSKEEFRGPGVDDIGLHARATNGTAKVKTRRGRKKTRDSETAEPEMTPDVMVKEEDEEHVGLSITRVVGEEAEVKSLASPPESARASTTPTVPEVEVSILPLSTDDPASIDINHRSSIPPPVDSCTPQSPALDDPKEPEAEEQKHKPKGRRNVHTKEAREAALAQRAMKDEVFLEDFDPHSDWLPSNTSQFDYTPELCKELERRYWRNCGLGKPAWYGADMQGSLFTDATTSWNVAHLPSALSRLLPASDQGLPGVNTPYLYFGMWRATFAWHVEDMDLFSINYIHFGAPKFWYAIPQARAGSLEQTMKGYFPKDTSQCPQFLRHKSYLASPKVLSQSSCRPNHLVQQAGEFVITFPRGYHAGFNLGFNCAESVNFALNSWLDLGRVAKACQCVDFSVRIDVDQLLYDRAIERIKADEEATKVAKAKPSRKRKADGADGPRPKKPRTKSVKKEQGAVPLPSPLKIAASKVTLKLGPKPKEPDVFPCCLCVSTNREGLLRVHDPPVWQKEGESGESSSTATEWMAHEECAHVVPETWVDDMVANLPDGSKETQRLVFGVDAIVKDRWNLKCNACTKTRQKAHGAPIQCTKGKCPKAYHVSCARDGANLGIVYKVIQEIEKEVLLIDPGQPAEASGANAPPVGAPESENPMHIEHDPGSEIAIPQVLKLIRKFEVQLLCPQHNPVITEAKKTAKQDRIRSELLALPPMTRIKLRVSAGVFEVSLLRVIEETKSVEVLWDRGLKREFKWGSVVFGSTESVVGHKPMMPAPEPDRSLATTPASQPSRLSFPPLGTSGSLEVRSSYQYNTYYTQHPGASGPIASSSTSSYTQSYPQAYPMQYQQSPSYAQRGPLYPYPSTSWTYPYGGHHSALAHNPQGQSYAQQQHPSQPPNSHPQYTVAQPNGSSQYHGGNIPYATSPYAQYPSTQPNSHTSGQSDQTTHNNNGQRPAYTAMTYQPYSAYGSHPVSANRTVHYRGPALSSHNANGELRWQQPYEGPKLSDTDPSMGTTTTPSDEHAGIVRPATQDSQPEGRSGTPEIKHQPESKGHEHTPVVASPYMSSLQPPTVAISSQ